MLHAQTHSHLHPQANRIAGYAFAISFNALLLMLLLVPMQGPPSLKLPGESRPAITWYMPRPEPPAVPPTVPVTPQPPTTQAVAPRVQVPPTAPALVVDQGSEQASPPALPDPSLTEVASIAAPDVPLAGARLEYLEAPPPMYPRAAMRAHSQGTVLLEVLVDVDGRPLRVEVRQGSGDSRLDAAARKQVLAHWRFRPAMHEGRAMQAIGLVPINFRLR
ncbi:MAG: energy transducer TonB [Pseudomonadota bacterium]|nr:energy transducer TonB [Pseudomonadota bacterium]